MFLKSNQYTGGLVMKDDRMDRTDLSFVASDDTLNSERAMMESLAAARAEAADLTARLAAAGAELAEERRRQSLMALEGEGAEKQVEYHAQQVGPSGICRH